jgi:beta-glucuronidase
MQNPLARSRTSLNGVWQVIIDWYDVRDDEIGRNAPPPDSHHFREFSFTDSLTLHVPGDWNSQRRELKYYEGAICYHRSFDYKKKGGDRLFLYFGGANYHTDVYLNGVKLGSHEGGFTPFQFEITRVVKAKNNNLVVIVNNRRHRDDIPALDYGWWDYGGITRDVNIIETPSVYVKDYFIHLAKNSLNKVEGWVKLDGASGPTEVMLGMPQAGIHQSIETDSSGYGIFSFSAHLSLWSPAHPTLYAVDFSTAVDTIKDHVGFRNVAVKGTDILLNGTPVFLKGVNMHEEIPERMGRAYSHADALSLLREVKDLGCNFVRLTHYPHNEHAIRLADKMGIMLWEEIPLWQQIAFSDPQILQKAEKMLAEMISRDKNRCGVIIWSVSNETTPGPDRNKTLIQLARAAHALDSTRLITSALSHFKVSGNKIIIDDPLCRYLDVIGVNRYMGWYTPWPSTPGDVEWQNPFKKPLIFSEFGAGALYGNHRSADTAYLWTEEYQERVYRDDIVMFRNMPSLRGTCPWLLADYRDPTRMHPLYQQGWNRKGLLSDEGRKKKAWYIIKRYYDRIKE